MDFSILYCFIEREWVLFIFWWQLFWPISVFSSFVFTTIKSIWNQIQITTSGNFIEPIINFKTALTNLKIPYSLHSLNTTVYFFVMFNAPRTIFTSMWYYYLIISMWMRPSFDQIIAMMANILADWGIKGWPFVSLLIIIT